MVVTRTASLVLVSLLVLVTGCGASGGTARSAVEQSSVSTTLECENDLRSTGQPDYALPAEPITEEPLDQTARFVDGTGTRRDYPDVEVVLADQQPTAQIIALVSKDKSVGILRYENDDALGWHLISVEQCSPMRAGQTVPAQVSYGGSAKQSRAKAVQAFLDDGGQVCGSDDLRRRFVLGGGAGGWSVGGLNIVNTSDHPCALLGPVRFVGPNSDGSAATSISTCDDMILKHQSCAAPIVLYPVGTPHPHQHPNAISVRLLGWGRGGANDSGCPPDRMVEPKILSLSLGDLSLRFTNHDPHWEPTKSFPAHMWGCGDIGIATGPNN